MKLLSMSFVVLLVITSLVARGNALGYLFEPDNVMGKVGANHVILTWDNVDGASRYFVTVIGGQSEIVTVNFVNLGGLMPLTSYTVLITASDHNATHSEPAVFDFTTMHTKVSELYVREATSNQIEVMWKEVENNHHYEVRVTNETDGEINYANVIIADNSAIITGLRERTFYHIYVKSVALAGDGEEAVLRARTDGQGVQVVNWWQGGNGVVGGEIRIFRPLQTEAGDYTIGIQLPCAVATVEFWDAEMQEEFSRPEMGYYQVIQKKIWMRRKTTIGMNIVFGQQTTCDFVNSVIDLTFGSQVAFAGNAGFAEKDFVLEQNQWANKTSGLVPSGGWIKFRLDQMFHGVNWGDNLNTDVTIEKPALNTYVLALDTGINCPVGFQIDRPWGMVYKDTSGMVGAAPNMHYFTQPSVSLWHNSIPGFVYGYNADLCLDQFNLRAVVLTDPNLVSSVYGAPDFYL